jgi:hypothetical protein
MYNTGLPLVIFLTGDKIDCEIEVGKCHFILDSELTWQHFCEQYPLAFCVGCSEDEKLRHLKIFQDLGFDILEENNASPISSFIARNAAFIQKFDALL